MSGIFERYKFQWELDQTEQLPYEGRQWSAALYQQDGPIARITLNRPEKRNALNDAMFADLMAGLHAARRDPEVRVVIIRAAGLAFSAGHDLSSPKGEETPPVSPELKPTVRDYYNIERRRCGKYEDLQLFPKITIAQVHGACIGAGAGIAAACDVTIAAEEARFDTPGFERATHGVHYHPLWPVASERVKTRSIPAGMSGADAAALGLVTKAVPGDELEAEVERWAQAFCRLPRDVLLLAKEWLNGVLDLAGLGIAFRVHYDGHIAIQWIRFHPDEVNFYKLRRDYGLRGYVERRGTYATLADET